MTKSSGSGTVRKIKGTITRVKVTIDQEFQPVVPMFIPDLDAVQEFAQALHNQNIDWQGAVFGWEAEYRALRREQPPHSNMTFTPAEFWIGDATLWGFSTMWEDGDDLPPVETLSDWNVVEELGNCQL